MQQDAETGADAGNWEEIGTGPKGEEREGRGKGGLGMAGQSLGIRLVQTGGAFLQDVGARFIVVNKKQRLREKDKKQKNNQHQDASRERKEGTGQP